MKKTILPLLLFVPFMAFLTANAQVCTPDTSYTSPGIYPATLPQACINQAYSFSVTVVVPQDTVVSTPFGSVTIPIDSLVLVTVLNLPGTLSYQCNPASCTFPGNGRGCVNLSGTPTALGTYPLSVVADVWVTVFGSPTNFRDTLVNAFTLTVGNPPTAAITGDTAICSGSSAMLDAGAGYDAYIWSNGDTTQTTSVTSAGTYWVRVFAGSCSDSTGITLNAYAPPSVNINTIDATCGQANGTATANATGNGPFSYLWSNGQTNAFIFNLAAGPYSVTVTDANGCSTVQSTAINSSGGPAVSLSSLTNVSCNGGNDGSATVNASGGTTPYTYLWSNGQTAATAMNLAAGTYTVTVTDSNNCISNLPVTITQPPALAATLSAQTNVSCNGGSDGSATVVAAGGTAPYLFRWSDGQNTATAVSLAAGRYQVIVTDANGCADTVAANLSQPTALMTSARADDPLCNGEPTGSILANASGGIPGYTFLWNTGATTAQLSGIPAGSYSCVVTDANGCKDTLRIPLNEPPALVLQTGFTGTTPAKNDGKAWAVPSGGVPPYTFLWSNNATTDTIQDLAPGDYTVIVTDANGCEAEETIKVQDATGIDEELAAGVAAMTVFPNPNAGTFTLELQLQQPDEVQVSLFDAAGRELQRRARTVVLQTRMDFELGSLPAGLYLLRVQTSRGATLRKVMRQ